MKTKNKQLLIPLIAAIAILAPLAARAQIIELIYGNAIAGVLAFILMFVVWILGMLFSLAVDIFIILIQLNPQELGGFAAQIDYVWLIVRDLCNMLFIIIMIIVAFGTILRIESYKWNKVLPKIIMVAILINFSKTIALIIIDASQVLMMTFVYAFRDIAAGNLAEGLGVTRLLKQGASNIKGVGGITTAGFQLLLPFVFAILLIAISILVLLVIAILLLVRIIVLWVLVAVSPIAYLGHILDATKKYSRMWWDNLIKYAMLGPALAFFLWFAFLFVGHNPIKNEDALPRDTPEEVRQGITYDYFGSDGSDPISFLNFTVTIILLLVGTNIAIKSGGLGAKAAGAVWNGGKQMGKNFMLGGAGIKTLGAGFSKLGGKFSDKGGFVGGLGKGLQGLGAGVGQFGKLAAAPFVLPEAYTDWRKAKNRKIKEGAEEWLDTENIFDNYLTRSGLSKGARARGVKGLIGGPFGTKEKDQSQEYDNLEEEKKKKQEELDDADLGQNGQNAEIDRLEKIMRDEIEKMMKALHVDILSQVQTAFNGVTGSDINLLKNDFAKELDMSRADLDAKLDSTSDKYDDKTVELFIDKVKGTKEYSTGTTYEQRSSVREGETAGMKVIENFQNQTQERINNVRLDNPANYVEQGRRLLEQQIAEITAKQYAIKLGIAVDADASKIDKAVQDLIKQQEQILRDAHEKLKLPGITTSSREVVNLKTELGKIHSQLDGLKADADLKIDWSVVALEPDVDQRVLGLNLELERTHTAQENTTTKQNLRDNIIKNITTKEATFVRVDGDMNKILFDDIQKDNLKNTVDASRGIALFRQSRAKKELGVTTDPDQIAYWKKEKELADKEYERTDLLFNNLSTYNTSDESDYRNLHTMKKESDFTSTTDDYQEYIKSLGFVDQNGNADQQAWQQHQTEMNYGAAGGKVQDELKTKADSWQKIVNNPPSEQELQTRRDEIEALEATQKKISEWLLSIKREGEASKQSTFLSKINDAMNDKEIAKLEGKNLINYFNVALKEGKSSKASAAAMKLAQDGDLPDLLKAHAYKAEIEDFNKFVNKVLIRKLGMNDQNAYMVQEQMSKFAEQNGQGNLAKTITMDGNKKRQLSKHEQAKAVLSKDLRQSLGESIGKAGSNYFIVDRPDGKSEHTEIGAAMIYHWAQQGLGDLIAEKRIAPEVASSIAKVFKENKDLFKGVENIRCKNGLTFGVNLSRVPPVANLKDEADKVLRHFQRAG